MSTEPTTEPTGEGQEDLTGLDERVKALEEELADRAERTNRALAAAQDRTYWLDVLHVDLDGLMRRPLPARLARLLPTARAAKRAVLKGREVLRIERLERQLTARSDEPGAAGGHSFRRSLEPADLRTAEVTELLLARADEGELEEVERRIGPDERALLDTAGPLDRKRFLLSFGVHHELPSFVERTGLRPDAPPSNIHSMGRGPAAAGGSPYYADLVADALRAAGAPLADGQSVLDFGCSSGRVVRVLAAAHPKIDWHGSDPIPDAIEWARKHLPGIAFEHGPETPPLPYEDDRFDAVVAISIWSHFSPRAATDWLREMGRIVKPGRHLVLTTHGYNTLAHEAAGRIRGAGQLLEIERSLYEHGFWFKNEFGPQGDHGVTNDDWGTAFVSPEWLLRRTTPDWELVELAPGRVERNQDLYVFRRR
jgi:SAM-dependent methyltransferase